MYGSCGVTCTGRSPRLSDMFLSIMNLGSDVLLQSIHPEIAAAAVVELVPCTLWKWGRACFLDRGPLSASTTQGYVLTTPTGHRDWPATWNVGIPDGCADLKWLSSPLRACPFGHAMLPPSHWKAGSLSLPCEAGWPTEHVASRLLSSSCSS